MHVGVQPEVSKYSSELLPLLFACLSKSSQDAGQRPRDVVRVYYAMETFCENLGMYTSSSLITYCLLLCGLFSRGLTEMTRERRALLTIHCDTLHTFVVIATDYCCKTKPKLTTTEFCDL